MAMASPPSVMVLIGQAEVVKHQRRELPATGRMAVSEISVVRTLARTKQTTDQNGAVAQRLP